ncbi:S-adenosyl-L-methionine-dependent methyltransferase [Colletotrichum caudatum]|nr:S-adenosyl-L-methionine-dependent methyltransferase [Colletotrichum caudatum]
MATEIIDDDEELKDGLDLLHSGIVMARHEKLSESPPPDKCRTLDYGTGTGIWAIQIAEKITPGKGEVLGFAVEKLQPDLAILPTKITNVSFRHGDLETLWRPEDQFGFVHTRVLPNDARDWLEFYRTAHKHLKEGGTFEMEALSLELLSDVEVPYSSRNLLLDHLNRVTINGDKKHLDFGNTKQLLDFEKTKQLLNHAGFRHIKEIIIPLPINPWDDPQDEKNYHRKSLGKRFNVILDFLLGIGQFARQDLGPSPQDLEEIYRLSNRAYCRL